MSEEFKNCSKCGRLIPADATTCPNCGAAIETSVYENIDGNNSGQGPQSVAPDVVAKRFNWGAFGFTWIWCLVYKQYLWALGILICSFIPLINFFIIGVMIYFGIKGNTWAWQAKHYKSVEEFHKIHKTWACWVLGLLIFNLLLGVFAAMIIPTLMNSNQLLQQQVNIKKSIVMLSQGSQLLQTQEEKLQDFSSEGLTNHFSKVMQADKISYDTLKTSDGITYKFFGNESCVDNGCYIQVDVNGEKGPNLEWTDLEHPTDIVNIPIRNEDNYVKVYSPDIVYKAFQKK